MKTCLARCGFIFSLLLLTFQPAHAESSANSRQQIERVIELFRKGIVDKDVNSFMTLFLRDDITWDSATDDAILDGIMQRRGDKSLPRPKKTFHGSPRVFIEGIAEAKKSFDETFDNIRIDTDGEVAQVWFDYVFKMDGVGQNSGKEAWHLLRTENGWKIASVTWSVTQVFQAARAAGAN